MPVHEHIPSRPCPSHHMSTGQLFLSRRPYHHGLKQNFRSCRKCVSTPCRRDGLPAYLSRVLTAHGGPLRSSSTHGRALRVKRGEHINHDQVLEWTAFSRFAQVAFVRVLYSNHARSALFAALPDHPYTKNSMIRTKNTFTRPKK